jgi:chloramphenicol O-acetyltransferase type B
MLKYVLGLIKNLLNSGVSLFAVVDNMSLISKKARVNRFAKLYNSNIDAYSYVGSNTELICAEIGKFSSIAHRCSIGLARHTINHISTSPIFTSIKNGTGYSWSDVDTSDGIEKVIIGNDVWIGIEVIIMGGVKIGNGVIIGAGSIVTKDVPDYAITAGVPARIISYRFEKDFIDKLLEIKWWDLPEEVLKANLKLFQKDDLSLEDLRKIERSII